MTNSKPKQANHASKRIVAEIIGDSAIELGIMLEVLGLTNLPKRDVDLAFIKLAIVSVNSVISKCSAKTGKKYPSIDDLLNFLRDDAELKPATPIEAVREIIDAAPVVAEVMPNDDDQHQLPLGEPDTAQPVVTGKAE
jgi:hypothetical protein